MKTVDMERVLRTSLEDVTAAAPVAPDRLTSVVRRARRLRAQRRAAAAAGLLAVSLVAVPVLRTVTDSDRALEPAGAGPSSTPTSAPAPAPTALPSLGAQRPTAVSLPSPAVNLSAGLDEQDYVPLSTGQIRFGVRYTLKAAAAKGSTVCIDYQESGLLGGSGYGACNAVPAGLVSQMIISADNGEGTFTGLVGTRVARVRISRTDGSSRAATLVPFPASFPRGGAVAMFVAHRGEPMPVQAFAYDDSGRLVGKDVASK